MSQVHDALQRASESDRNRPRPPVTQGRLKPVGDSGGSSLVLWAGVLLALALAGWFFWHWWKASHLPASAQRTPGAAVAPRPETPPGVLETDAPASMPAATSASTSANPPRAEPVGAAWPAELKLMGIFFSKTNPMALINGKTLGVGESIDGIRVTKIERERVSVQWKGQVKVLIMD